MFWELSLLSAVNDVIVKNGTTGLLVARPIGSATGRGGAWNGRGNPGYRIPGESDFAERVVDPAGRLFPEAR
jgi:hypothetical protein